MTDFSEVRILGHTIAELHEIIAEVECFRGGVKMIPVSVAEEALRLQNAQMIRAWWLMMQDLKKRGTLE